MTPEGRLVQRPPLGVHLHARWVGALLERQLRDRRDVEDELSAAKAQLETYTDELEKAAETRPHLLARPPYLPPELEHELPRDKRTALGVSVPAASVPGDTVAAPKSCKPSPLELLVELKRRQTTMETRAKGTGRKG